MLFSKVANFTVFCFFPLWEVSVKTAAPQSQLYDFRVFNGRTRILQVSNVLHGSWKRVEPSAKVHETTRKQQTRKHIDFRGTGSAQGRPHWARNPQEFCHHCHIFYGYCKSTSHQPKMFRAKPRKKMNNENPSTSTPLCQVSSTNVAAGSLI